MIVRYVDLPYCIRGFVRLDPDGDYNVYLNSRYCYEILKDVLKHELEHIRRGDFYNNLEIYDVEEK